MKRLITIIIVIFVNTICIRANGIMNNNENRLHLFELMNLDKQGDLSKRHNQLIQNREMNEGLSDNGLNQKSLQNSPHISRQNTTFSRDGHLYLYTSLLQNWDESNWVNQWGGTNTYDSDGNVINSLTQSWDGNDWENYSQYTYTCDSDGNQLSELRQHWDGSEWVNQWQYTNTYDNDGNQLSYLTQFWDGNNWVNNGQYTNTYDNDGNQLSGLFQYWDGSIWVNSSQYIDTYDNDGNRLSWLGQIWDGSDWVNNSLHTYTYDNDGNQLSELSQDWDGSDWVNNGQYTYTYDSDGNVINSLYQEWDGNDWVNIGQYIDTYDNDSNLLIRLHQSWDGNDWKNYSQNTYTYNSDGNVINWLHQNWSVNEWVNQWQYTNTYDSDGNVINSLSQDWDGNDWENYWQYTYTYHTEYPILLTIDDQIINEDSSLTITLNVTSVLNTTFTFSAFSDLNTVNISMDNNLIILVPDPNWSGSSNITVIVIDGNSLSDTTSFLLTVNPVNDTPEPFNVLYPTVTDTFSSHLDSNQDIGFTWGNCNDVDNDVEYSLTIFLEFFGNYYYDVYDNITDTTISISGNNLDDLLGGLNISETPLNWYVMANDEDYSVSSDTGEFVLSRSLLDVLDDSSIPTVFTLHQNYPNPFNPVTTLRYDLPENSFVNITIYDILGREVRTLVNKTQEAGFKSIIWDTTNDYGKPVSTGVYLYKIQSGEFVQVKKMVMMK